MTADKEDLPRNGLPLSEIKEPVNYENHNEKATLLDETAKERFPFVSIIMGDISQNFIDAVVFSFANSSASGYNERMDDFNNKVIHNCLKYVYLGCIIFVAACIQEASFLLVCESMVNRLRRHFFKAIMRQDIAWFDKNQSGSLGTKLFDNIERVKEGTGDKIGLMFQFTSQFIGGFIVAFTYDWVLTLCMCAFSPLMICCGAFISKIMASASTEEAKNYAKAGAIAEEALTSSRTVMSFNAQKYESDRYDRALKVSEKIGIKKSLLVGVGLAITFLVIFSSYCFAFYMGTNFVHSGRLQGGTVMTVFFAVMMGSMAMGHATQQFGVLGAALGAAGALYEVIDRTPDIDSYSEEGKKPKDVRGEIQVSNLRFSYPTRPEVEVLKGLNFTVEQGQTVALVGSSGCGKSTVVSLLLHYYDPDSGDILIDGIPIKQLNIEHLRNIVGVVSQEPQLFSTTIEENIRYGREDVTTSEITDALRKANAYEFVKEFPDGLKTLVGDRGAQMSGGQKQRIAIARALVRNPRILLLDEATSALDAESESIVQEALENASKNRTTLVVAHRLSTIKNADKIVAIKDGEVVEIGTHQELLAKKGFYYELVNAQVFVDVDDEKPKLDRMASSPGSVTRRRTSSIHDEIRRLQSQLSGGLTNREVLDENANALKRPEEDLERLKRELEEEGAAKANLFRILKYAKPELPYLIIATIAAIVQGGVFPVFSLFFSQIIEVFSLTGDELLREGHFWSLMFLVLAVVTASTMFFQATFYGIAAEKLTLRLRSKVFRNVMRMDGTYFDNPCHSPGKISTRLSSDAPTIKAAIDYRIGGVFNSVISVAIGLIIAFYFCWQMAFLVTLISPLLGVSHSIHMKYMSGKANKDAKEMENSGKIALEAIENIRTVQALTLQKRLHEKFCHHLERPHRNNRQKAIFQVFLYGFAASIFFFIYAASFRFGVYLIVKSIVSNPMNILRTLFAISFSAGSLGQVAAYFGEYAKATFAAGLVFKMLEEEPLIDGVTNRGKKPTINGAIEFLKVFFRYPERQDVTVLQGLDLSVNPGETLAIVGSSGCGKSTCISLLERFYDPFDGSIV
ncbi:hypothetical protein WR25_25744 isoform A [Diploscapter pachys]|uniref:ABC transmembrane type-1 domain-containing protein n=1 Tax=Diploscapter pachys TaxID=2018661 RepID=A0A2A2JDQ8_9BILA|nr:hypothetical protein WR25_25744 isoform A [Diploscapter pachys]